MSRWRRVPPLLLMVAGVALMAAAGQIAHSAPDLVGPIVFGLLAGTGCLVGGCWWLAEVTSE